MCRIFTSSKESNKLINTIMKATKETQRKEVQGGYLLLERKVRVNANGVKQATSWRIVFDSRVGY